MDDLFTVEGRTAVVTGAASGMGARFAQTLARYGARVICVSRRAGKVEATTAAIRSGCGEAAAIAFDICDRAGIPAFYDAAERVFGTVDILVNAAGISGDAGTPTHLHGSDDWDRVIATNLTAAYEMSKEAARRLIGAGKPGNIINITSAGAVRGGAGIVAYTASKAGCANMTRSMALDLVGHGIRVNAIAPGIVSTEMFPPEAAASDFGRAYIAHGTPYGRVADPSELDGVLMLLASRKASSFLVGTQIEADGGIGAAQPGAFASIW